MNRRVRELQAQISRERGAGSAAPAVRSWACMKLGVEGAAASEATKRAGVPRWSALFEKGDWNKSASRKDKRYQAEAIVFLEELGLMGLALRQAAKYVKEFGKPEYEMVLDFDAKYFSALKNARRRLDNAKEKLEEAGQNSDGVAVYRAGLEVSRAQGALGTLGMMRDGALLEAITDMLLNSLFREEFAEHEVYAIQKFAEKNMRLLNNANIYLAANVRQIGSFEGIAMLAKILERHVLAPGAKFEVAVQFCRYAQDELKEDRKMSDTEAWMFGQFQAALSSGHMDEAGEDSGIRISVFIMAALRLVDLKKKTFEELFLK